MPGLVRDKLPREVLAAKAEDGLGAGHEELAASGALGFELQAPVLERDVQPPHARAVDPDVARQHGLRHVGDRAGAGERERLAVPNRHDRDEDVTARCARPPTQTRRPRWPARDRCPAGGRAGRSARCPRRAVRRSARRPSPSNRSASAARSWRRRLGERGGAPEHGETPEGRGPEHRVSARCVRPHRACRVRVHHAARRAPVRYLGAMTTHAHSGLWWHAPVGGRRPVS